MAVCALHGIGVSRGYAIGQILRLQRDQTEVVEYRLSAHQIEPEMQRFQRSITIAKQELQQTRERLPASLPAEISAFVDTHLLMLEDSLLTHAPLELIRTQQCNAEWALKMQRDQIVQVFETMDDTYLRARRDDIDHVVTRIQRILIDGAEQAETAPPNRFAGRIVVADDLAPADTILMQHQGIYGFITEFGGPLSHTAILARSLGIPALVGIHNARRYLQDGEMVVIDGQHGVVLAGLEPPLLAYYRQRQRAEQQRLQQLRAFRNRPARTLDSLNITLHANIELPEDITAALDVGAAGVGLYRTEFLFMNRDQPPCEDEQFETYRDALIAFEGRPVTIRSLDIGADKQVDRERQDRPRPTNPALGLRAIRLCLREPALFRPQLRAILRASIYGQARLMIPMLSSIQEVIQVLQIVRELKKQLQDDQLPFDPQLPIGGMIEIPAAALCADYLARNLDFLSIGTNDLIQYTLAIDRTDDSVNYLYEPLHPGVLKLIHMTLTAGHAAGVPVSLCGEMAGDTHYTRLLLGLGLTQFSMHTGSLLEIKQIVTNSDVGELRQLARQALLSNQPQDLMSRLTDQ
jgi:phosphotransferase system enzyme I (PtsI)